MTPKEREAFYDAEIAPTLMALCKRCEANGMSFLAMVEWEPGRTGQTMGVREGASIALLMAFWSMQLLGNADALILKMMQHGANHGHNSAMLSLLERIGAPSQ